MTARKINARNLWIDYAKGIGIILVVYGHVTRGIVNAKIPMNEIAFLTADRVIYTFHMPLFFFLAGLFFYESLEKRTWSSFVASKVDSILYPYILWSIIQGSIEVFSGRFSNGSVTFAQVFSLLWAPRAQFWFLYTLFQIFLLSSLIYRKNNKWYFLCVSLAASISYLSNLEPTGFSWLLSLLQNFCFFSLGIFYNTISDLMNRFKTLLALPLFLAFLGGQYILNFAFQPNHTSTAIASYFIALFSIAFTCTLCQIISNRKLTILSSIGKLSMPIFLTHVIAAAGTRIALQKLFGINNPTIHILLGMISGLGIPVIIHTISYRIGLGFIFTIPSAFSLQNFTAREAR